ncbi:MAG: hypothetical protein ABSG31_12120 [Tepidisphaeraceae bacterium]|jgi:hypothetical protein
MSKPKLRRKKSDPNLYPPGWNYKRAKAIADYYDARKSEPLLGEIMKKNTVLVQVPRKLLPAVLKLIDKRKKSA